MRKIAQSSQYQLNQLRSEYQKLVGSMYGVPKVSELVYALDPKPSPFLKALKKPPPPAPPKKEERALPPKQLLIASHADNCDISVILDENTSSRYHQMFKPEFAKPAPV